MTRLAVLQPSYMPWLGYFDQMASCDVFVFYDDVQYDREGWRNRNRIRATSPQGWTWLTIPVLSKGFPLLNEVLVDARYDWRRKHYNTLHHAYSKAPFRSLLDGPFQRLFTSAKPLLCEINLACIEIIRDILRIATPTYRSSELGVSGDRNERLIEICRRFGAREYLTGRAASAYLDEALFARNGIRVVWHDYPHPIYPQRQEPFVSHLSAIDAILEVGPGAGKFVGLTK